MSDNWVVQNLQNALDTWNKYLSEIWQLITQSPEQFKGGSIWGVIVNIHDAVRAIGLALLVLFFVVGVMRTCGMIGEVVGMAASVCMKRNALPRDIYTTYFADLQELMRKGTGRTDVPYTQFYHQVDRTGHQAEDR